MSQPQPTVFINYAQEDKKAAKRLYADLEKNGAAPWLDEESLLPGQKRPIAVKQAIRDSRYFLTLLSSNSVTERGSVQKQLVEALDLLDEFPESEVFIIPVRLDECSPSHEKLHDLHRVDLFPSWEEGLERILRAIGLQEKAKAVYAPIGEPRKGVTLPPIFHLPHPRNPNFTGRHDLLAALRTALTSGQPAALTQAIHGLGGIGKTQLAVEYAYRHAAHYTLIWWVRAEQPATLAADYAALAAPLDLPEKDHPEQPVIIEAVCHWFTQNPGWLLVFDNAPGPEQVRPYLPQAATGHVLVTSRNPAWRGLANPLTVPVWPRTESIAFLLKRTGQDDETTAHDLADALGDLPLALEQAGAYVEAKATTLAAYLDLFQTRRTELWQKERPPLDYPDTVETTWHIAFQQVRETSPAGADLLNLCAFLAPDDIPHDLLSQGTERIPQPLSGALSDPLAFDEAVATLRRYALLERTGDTLSLHRLVQAVARDRLPPAARPTWAAAAAQIVNDAFPSEGHDVRTWPQCNRLLPHALAAAGHAEALEVASEATGRLFPF